MGTHRCRPYCRLCCCPCSVRCCPCCLCCCPCCLCCCPCCLRCCPHCPCCCPCSVRCCSCCPWIRSLLSLTTILAIFLIHPRHKTVPCQLQQKGRRNDEDIFH